MTARAGWRPYRIDPDLGHQLDSYLATKVAQASSWTPSDRLRADRILCELIEGVALDILDREGLPHLAHLICGWGNAEVSGRTLFERIFDFADSSSGARGIPQNDPNGDFHPWQSFAYCTMSDLRALQFTHNELNLETLARNSIDLNTHDETDLGHFLFTVGCMSPNARPRDVIFSRRSVDITQLIGSAIEGHYYGGFEVCRKFHLTEGLCSVSRAFTTSIDRRVVDEFLRGQLDSLRPLAAIVRLVADHFDLDIDEMPEEASALLSSLRKLLVLGEAVENLFYYSGHLIELAAIGIQSGYETPKAYKPLITLIVEGLDNLLVKIQGDLAFAESFYAFAHYRRGIDMFASAMQLQSGTLAIGALKAGRTDAPHRILKKKAPRPFVFAQPKPAPRDRFRAVLDVFNSNSVPSQRARGEFAHFRKIMPPGLPLGVHFELLDHETFIGAELHCEREEHKDHLLFEGLAREIERRMSVTAIFDPRWYKGCGRVVVPCADDWPPGLVARTMREVIAFTSLQLAERYGAPIVLDK